ncbi:MAG: MoaD/ThiS family protein [Phycisphaerae bacterium]
MRDSKDMTSVTVRFLGPAADVVGHADAVYELCEPATLGTLIELLYARYPKLAEHAGVVRFAVNSEYADPSQSLRTGDEVALIPPVSGG